MGIVSVSLYNNGNIKTNFKINTFNDLYYRDEFMMAHTTCFNNSQNFFPIIFEDDLPFQYLMLFVPSKQEDLATHFLLELQYLMELYEMLDTVLVEGHVEEGLWDVKVLFVDFVQCLADLVLGGMAKLNFVYVRLLAVEHLEPLQASSASILIFRNVFSVVHLSLLSLF